MKQDDEYFRICDFHNASKAEDLSGGQKKTSRKISLLVGDITSQNVFDKVSLVFMECHLFKIELPSNSS